MTAQFVDMGGVHAASSATGEGATPVAAAANPTPMLVQIAVSEDHACVARRDGAVLCWGSGEGYSPTPALMNLASGDARAALLPSGDSSMALVTAADVPGLAGVTFMQVSSAGDRSCGITTDDRVKCWEGTHASVDVPIS